MIFLVRCFRQGWEPAPARGDLMLVHTVLQDILGVCLMLTQAELVEPCPQVFLLVELESQLQGNIQETCSCNNGGLYSQPLCRVIKGVM